MSHSVITSFNNPQIKNLNLLQKKARARKDQGLFVVEGIKMFEEAREAGILVKAYISESFYQEKLDKQDFFIGLDYEIVADSVIKQVADTMTPQGIMGTVRMPIYRLDQMISKNKGFLILLEDIRDPGNMGTIIRTAEAAGVTGIILNRSCADIFQPKVVRSTMGSIYRLPYYEVDNYIEFLPRLKSHGYTLYAAHLSGQSYDCQDGHLDKCGLLIGNEAKGLSDEASNYADKLVRIPMAGKVESLNAAIASAILMYELARQMKIDID